MTSIKRFVSNRRDTKWTIEFDRFSQKLWKCWKPIEHGKGQCLGTTETSQNTFGFIRTLIVSIHGNLPKTFSFGFEGHYTLKCFRYSIKKNICFCIIGSCVSRTCGVLLLSLVCSLKRHSGGGGKTGNVCFQSINIGYLMRPTDRPCVCLYKTPLAAVQGIRDCVWNLRKSNTEKTKNKKKRIIIIKNSNVPWICGFKWKPFIV